MGGGEMGDDGDVGGDGRWVGGRDGGWECGGEGGEKSQG